MIIFAVISFYLILLVRYIFRSKSHPERYNNQYDIKINTFAQNIFHYLINYIR